MESLEKLHLQASGGNDEYEHDMELASKSAQITKDIAIEFAIWLNKTDEIIENTKHIDFSKSDEDVAKELFQEFLKTKDNV